MLVQIWQLFSKLHFKMQYLLQESHILCICSVVEQTVNVSSSNNNLRPHFNYKLKTARKFPREPMQN